MSIQAAAQRLKYHPWAILGGGFAEDLGPWNCLGFGNSSGHRVDLGSSLSFGNGTTDDPFTIEVTADVHSFGVNFLCKYDAPQEFSFGIGGTGNIVGITYDSSNSSYRGRIGSASGIGASDGFRRYSMTYDGTENSYAAYKLYQDSTRKDTSNFGAGGTYTAMQPGAAVARIGGTSALSGTMDGQIVRVRIWNVDKSAQIDAGTPDATGLIHHYTMDAGSGSVLTDLQGSLDGTIVGAPWETQTYEDYK